MGFHFYTTNPNERDVAVDQYGFLKEGILGFVAPMPVQFPEILQGSPMIPLYRLFKPTLGDHFYTTSPMEHDNAAANLGYVSEGIACYIIDGYPPPGEKRYAPVRRMYQPKTGEHFYSSDPAEALRANSVDFFDWEAMSGVFPDGSREETPSVFVNQIPGTTPFFRLFCPGIPGPKMQKPAPAAPHGIKGFALYNCHTNSHELHVWTNDLTAGTGWVEQKTLQSQKDANGNCPAGAAPFFLILTPGHAFYVAVLDPQMCDGKNDPINGDCLYWYPPYPVVGDDQGDTVSYLL